jgi:CheY-like chemotaxis protein
LKGTLEEMKYTSAETETKTEPHKGKILIVDDAPSLNKHITYYLTELNYHFEFVNSIEEANSLFDNTRLDVILYAHELRFLKIYHQNVLRDTKSF